MLLQTWNYPQIEIKCAPKKKWKESTMPSNIIKLAKAEIFRG